MNVITKEDLLSMANVINHIFEKLSQDTTLNPKFLYGLRRNADIIRPIAKNAYDDLQPKFKDVARTLEYENQRTVLCKEYAEKDEKGEPIIQNKKYKIFVDKKDEFEAKSKELGEKFNDVIEEKKQQIALQEKILKETVEIDFFKIKVDYLPESGVVTPEMIDIIYPMITD